MVDTPARHTLVVPRVSIPSRGFWFFEAIELEGLQGVGIEMFQSPRGDFGFLKRTPIRRMVTRFHGSGFQSPRGDFGFLKRNCPSDPDRRVGEGFNPLAGILVF